MTSSLKHDSSAGLVGRSPHMAKRFLWKGGPLSFKHMLINRFHKADDTYHCGNQREAIHFQE